MDSNRRLRLMKGREKLRINIVEDDRCEEMEITVCCKKLTSEVEKLVTLLRVMDLKLTGSRAGESYILDAEKVL